MPRRSPARVLAQLFAVACLVPGCRPRTGSGVKRAEVLAGSNDVSPLGQAYAGPTKRLLNLNCVEGGSRRAGGEVGELTYAREMSSSQIQNKLNVNAAVGATVDFITVTPQAKLAMAHASNDLDDTVTFIMTGTTQTLTFDSSQLKVSKLGQQYIDAYKDRLAELCGTEFINEIHYGATLIASVKISFIDQQTKRQYVGGLEVDLAHNALSASATLTHLSDQQKRNVTVHVQVDQQGGDPLQLQTLLGDAPLHCNFDDMQACLGTMGLILSYAKGPFKDSLLASDTSHRSTWNVQSYTTKSYTEAGLIDLVPTTQAATNLPSTTVDALNSLQTSYNGVLDHLALAQLMRQTFAGLVSGDVFGQIKSLENALRGELAALPAVQQQCYQKPGDCADLVARFQQQLGQLDANLLTQVNGLSGPATVSKSKDALGGQGGQAFDDSPELSLQKKIVSLAISVCGQDGFVTGLASTYADQTTKTHGTRQGSCQTQSINLQQDTLSRVTIYLSAGQGDLVVSGLRFEWQDQPAQTFGRTSNSSLGIDLPSGYSLGGFYGQEGTALDKLGLVFVKN